MKSTEIMKDQTSQDVSRFNKIMPDTKCHDFKIDVIWSTISYAKSIFFNTDRHKHSFCEIYCVLDGSIKIEVRNKIITLKKDDCIILPPNLEHRIVEYTDDLARYDVGFKEITETPLNNINTLLKNNECLFIMTSEMKSLLSYMTKYASLNNRYSSAAIGNAVNAFVIDVLNHIVMNNELNELKKIK